MSTPELWIGLVWLKPLNEKDFGAAGAYTNIVTWACDAQEFHKKAETLAASLDLYVVSTEGQERFSDRVERASVSDEIQEMAMQAESNPNAILFAMFHTYPFDDA